MQFLRYTFIGDRMKKQNNICKFVDNSVSGSLITRNFVFEKDAVTKSALPKNHCIYLVTSGKGLLKTENFTQKISVTELCFLFSTNKTTLSREFKRVYGKTIVDYLNGLRIKHTKRLLRKKNYSLTQIAEMLNMSSVHYLTALFKKYERLTPTEYTHTIKQALDAEQQDRS